MFWLLNIEYLSPVIQKVSATCVWVRPTLTHLLYILVGKATWLWICGRNVTFSQHSSGQALKCCSLDRDWTAHHQTCPGRGTTVRPPQTKSSLHLAVLCSCLSEVLIQECCGCFWKVSCGRSSFKHSVKGQGPHGRKLRECSIKRMGLPSIILPSGPDFCLNGNQSSCVYMELYCVYENWLLSHKEICFLFLSLPPKRRPASVCRKAMATYFQWFIQSQLPESLAQDHFNVNYWNTLHQKVF